MESTREEGCVYRDMRKEYRRMYDEKKKKEKER